MSKNKVERHHREVLEGKLLAALDDKDTVAVLLNKSDLELLIVALATPVQVKQKWKSEFAASLRQLRDEAFG